MALPLASMETVLTSAPSIEKMTEPVGVPPLPLTVAVKVMPERTWAGVPLDWRATCVVARTTLTGRAVEALGLSLTSPL